MTRKFFGTDGIRGLTNSEPMTAETALREQGARRKKMKAALDEAAAQHILQAYFEALRVQRAAHDLW